MCQEGDVAAFEELVGRWQERLWRHAWRLTGDEEAAWDALQEAWIAVSRGIGRLDDASAFPAWAYRITSNKCRDWIRRESRRHGAMTAHEWTAEPVTADDLSERQAETEQALGLAEALARLPGRDRSILHLRYVEGFDLSEIAAILEIPAGTVKSRLYHARARLRKMMKETNDESV